MRQSLRAICLRPDEESTIDPARLDDAMAFMALCVGGIALARAVDSPDLSERILAVCRQAVERVAAPGNEPPRNPEAPAHAAC